MIYALWLEGYGNKFYLFVALAGVQGVGQKN